MLEENYIEGYTVIPKFGQIGFEIAAFTFMKSKLKFETGEEKRSIAKNERMVHETTKCNSGFRGRGMGWDAACISLHENFSNFAEFIRKHDSELSEWVIESQTFHADLKAGIIIKPFHLKYLTTPQ